MLLLWVGITVFNKIYFLLKPRIIFSKILLKPIFNIIHNHFQNSITIFGWRKYFLNSSRIFCDEHVLEKTVPIKHPQIL